MSDNKEEYCTCSRHTNNTLHPKNLCKKETKPSNESETLAKYLMNAQRGIHENHRMTTRF